MPEDEELLEIAEDEIGHTFESITDLDNISDTTVLAITFLLSAQVSLSALILQSQALVTGRLQFVFVTLGLGTMVLTCLSINAIIQSLLPVGFYGENVGQPLLTHPYLPLNRNLASQFEPLERTQGPESNEEIDQDYQTFVDEFVEDYSSENQVDDYNDFQLAKLYHFKQVGKRKAQYAGSGLAWLRLAVLFFLIQFGVAFAGTLVQ